ncbi:RluA family pseudouridine synthase [bacterium]|nr:RluA family pseudouridine synthase [bacterium]
MRLDTYLQETVEQKYGVKLSRSYIERLLEAGGVVLNEEIIKKKGFSFDPSRHHPEIKEEVIQNILSVYKTGKRQDEEADAWDASEMGVELDEYRVKKAGDIKKNIVLENDDILVVNKPPGVSSHPGRGDRGADSMVYQFIKYMREAYKYIPRAGLLHRLDKDTQGLLLFAKNMQTYNEVKAQFESREIQKYYLAVCDKTPQLTNSFKQFLSSVRNRKGAAKSYKEYKTVDELITSVKESQKPLVLDGQIGRKKGTPFMVYTQGHRAAGNLIGTKNCVSDVYVISEVEDNLELLFVPHTGRTHQIRAQARYLGASVRNDRMYGLNDTHEGTLQLCAVGVSFSVKGKKEEISLPIAKILP